MNFLVWIFLPSLLLLQGPAVQQTPSPEPTTEQSQEEQAPSDDETPAFPRQEQSTEAQQGSEQSPSDSPSEPYNWAIMVGAIFQVLAAVAVAVFTGFLVYYNRRLLSATKQAAEAAKQSGNVASEALVKTERAFVHLRHFQWLWHPDTDTPGKYWYSFHPLVENAGNTPTKNMTIVVEYELRDRPLPDGFDFTFKSSPGNTLIGPRGGISAAEGKVTDNELRAVQLRTKYFYAWGKAEYMDTFDGTPRHTTKFCSYIGSVRGDPYDPTKPLEIHFMVHKEHNSTD